MSIIELPPVEEMLDMAHWAVEREEWDMLAEFVTLVRRPGEILSPATIVIMAGDIHPYDYPKIMSDMTLKELERRAEGETSDIGPCALLLNVEGYSVEEPGVNASDAEKERFRRDRFERNFHERDDRREVKMASVADLSGRMVTATRYRDNDTITERLYAPGDPAIGGNLPEGLVYAATTLGRSLKAAGLWDEGKII